MNLILRLFSKESFILNLKWYFPVLIIIVLSIVSNANVDTDTELPPAAEILSKVAKSESTVDYVGKRIVVRWHRGIMASEELVIHQAPSTNLIKLLIPVNRMGFERRPDRDDKEQSRGKRGEWYRTRRMPPPGDRRRGGPQPPSEMRNLQDIWQTNTKLLLRNYTVDVSKGELIAGQKTYLLAITPKFALRPKKRVWLDEKNYIILRLEDYDINGEIKLLSVYTTIDYDSASVAKQMEQYKKERQSSGERERDFNSELISFAEAEKRLGVKLPQSSYLPIGFQLQDISAMTFSGRMGFGGNPPIHFRYTDGLTALSLFVSIRDEGERGYERSRRGDRFGDKREREGERRDSPGQAGSRFRSRKPMTVTIGNIPVSVIERGRVRTLLWKVHKQSEGKNLHFVLISELSQEELIKVVEALISQG